MTKAKEASLRRIAIVLESLPASVAQRLLGSLQSDNQRQVRAALTSLSDVDPLERRRALDGFARSLRHGQGHSQQPTDAAEVVFSQTAIRNLNERGELPKPATPSPLAFLLDVDDETLVAHLSGEMPQTLAIILASISPAQAARVLPRLDVSVRAEAMRRIAKLGDTPSELIDEIGTQLRSRFVPAGGNRGAGKRALDAILAEMHDEPRPPSPLTRSTALATDAESDAGMSMVPDSDRPPALKLAEGSWPESEGLQTRPAHSPRAGTATGANATERPSPLKTRDSIHAYLTSLPVDRLRDALARVAVRQALLALCGLPNTTAEAVLASLPRRQSKQVREQISALGTLELREIDKAKEAVAIQAFHDHAAPTAVKMAAAA